MKWPEVPVAAFCKTGSGGTPSRAKQDEYFGGTIPWVKSGELLDVPLSATEEQITPTALSESSAKLVPPGAVLIAMYGATVGRTALLEIEAATNQAVCFLIPDKRLADSRYLWFALRACYNDLLAKRVGGAQPNISQQIIKATRLPLPPLSEQRHIVEILDEADRLHKLRREADAKAARILAALFLKMFGDPATNPNRWPIESLGQLADERPEYGANASAVPFEHGKPRYVRITDIREDGTLSDKEVVTLDAVEWSRYLLCQGDVLFARSGNTVGKTYIYRPADGTCAFAGYLIRFRFASGKIDPWFVFGLTQTPYYRAWVEAHKRVAGQPNINGQEYASLQVPVPSDSLQHQFARKSQEIEELLVRTNNAADRLNSLFSTLIQLAFSGELTTSWREAHMKELLAEMEQQAKLLNLPPPNTERLAARV